MRGGLGYLQMMIFINDKSSTTKQLFPRYHDVNFPNTFKTRFLFVCFNVYNSQCERDDMQQLKGDEGKTWTLCALTWLQNVLENYALHCGL